MQDLIGRTLEHYRIVEKIGAGGMGVVYKAHDERLGRDVAIKTILGPVAKDEQRMARFEREAKLLASLSHQNIAQLYGLEKVERTVGEGLTPSRETFLVMEFADGETLARKIAKGPISIDDALDYASQIAKGLEAAHKQGIIHRDLKPANVMVSSDGKIKILDFGLAKGFESPGSSPSTPESIADSPTLTAAVTGTGALLGTAAYMSPEQARGKQVDKKTDVWAFGCVLYEMLTGSKAFEGDDASQIMAAILRDDPEWSELPPGTPNNIRRLLARCLVKAPRDRLHDIADARIELQTLPADEVQRDVGVQPPTRTVWQRLLPWALIAVFGTIAIGMVASNMNRNGSPPIPIRFVCIPPVSAPLATAQGTDVAISPDGNTIAYVAWQPGSTQLCIRSMDQLDVSCIAGTEGGRTPFFSPDGQWLGYFSFLDQKLKKLPVTRGPSVPVEICDANDVFSASWGHDGAIVFGSIARGRGILRVSSSGGQPTPLTEPSSEKSEVSHDSPVMLPDEKTMLFVIRREGGNEDALIVAQDLASGERVTLAKGGTNVHYSSTGHIIYNRAGSLLAAPFDHATLEVGTWTPVEDGVRVGGVRAGEFALSENGTLVYVHGVTMAKSSLVWADRQGEETDLSEQRGFYHRARVSPGGDRVAVQVRGARKQEPTRIMIFDVSRRVFEKWSFGEGCWDPIWSPDGSRIAFVGKAHGTYGIYLASLDDFEVGEPVFSSNFDLYLSSWSPDGELIAFMENHPETKADLWLLSLPDAGATPFRVSSADEAQPDFSPDGGWISYVSNESGMAEVYVQPLKGADRILQISMDGGHSPSWAPSGRELFFRNRHSFNAVPVSTRTGFKKLGPPRRLFEKEGVGDYDVHPDGSRFLLVRESADKENLLEIRVVLNWSEELNRLAPTN